MTNLLFFFMFLSLIGCKSSSVLKAPKLGQETVTFRQNRQAYFELIRVFQFNMEKLKKKCLEKELPEKMRAEFFYSKTNFGEYKCFKSLDFRVAVPVLKDLALRDHLRLIRKQEHSFCWATLCEKFFAFEGPVKFYSSPAYQKIAGIKVGQNYYSDRQVIYLFQENQKVFILKSQDSSINITNAKNKATGKYGGYENRLVFVSHNDNDQTFYHEAVLFGDLIKVNVYDVNLNFLFNTQLFLANTN